MFFVGVCVYVCMNEALVPALPPPQALSEGSDTMHNPDADLQAKTLARTSLMHSNGERNHDMLAVSPGVQSAAMGGQGKPGQVVGEGTGQAQEGASIKELKHGLEVANTRLMDMERHVRMLSERIVHNPSLFGSSALTAASLITNPLAGPDDETGEVGGAGGARETQLQQRIAHLERLLVAQCEAQHSHLLPSQPFPLAQNATPEPHPVAATIVPEDVAPPPPPHPAPSLPLSEERRGSNTVESPVGETQRAGNQRESIGTRNMFSPPAQSDADKMAAAVQDDALLVLHSLENQGNGLEQENEWNSEEQRLATFVSWPFSDKPLYPQVLYPQVCLLARACNSVGVLRVESFLGGGR